MATAYTSILKLALPVQGELSGTWGDVVNDNITSMVEEAIAGRAVINTWTANSHTLTSADGTTSESRCAMLEFTDTGTALTGDATVVCPTQPKIYICKNGAGQKVTIKTSAGTGVAIADGQTMFVFCDGTNVVEAVTSMSSLKLGTAATSVQVTAVLDEDDLVSDSATALATQQSIKAYVDAQVTAQDLDFGGDSGTGSVDLDSQTFTIAGTANEIETSASGQTLTVGLPAAVTVTTSVTTPLVQATNVNANDGSSAIAIADSTGQTTINDAVLTTADINAGTIDNTTIGATTASTGAFTTITSSGNTTVSGQLVTDTISEETATAGVTVDGVLLKDGGATLTGDLTVDTDTLYVDSTNNNVGIGLTNPTSHNANAVTLQVDGGTNGAEVRLTNDTTGTAASNGFHIATVGNKTYLVQNEADDLYVYTNGQEVLRFNSSYQSIFGASANRQVLVNTTTNTNATDATLILQGNSAGSVHGKLFIASSTTTPTTNQGLGFVGLGDANKVPTGFIGVYNDATWSTGTDMPTRMSFHTTADGASSASERMRITNDGLVGINVSSSSLTGMIEMLRGTSAGEYHMSRFYSYNGSSNKRLDILIDNTEAASVATIETTQSGGSAVDLAFAVNNGNEAMRINTSAYAIISSTGNTRSMSLGSTISRLTIEGTSATAGRAGAAAVHNTNDTSGPVYYLAKSRGTANNSNTIVQADDYLGQLNWNGADGTQMVQAGNISLRVDGTPGVNDMPGRLIFQTTSDGANSPSERMRINQSSVVISNSGQFANQFGNATRTNLQVDGSGEAIFTLSVGGTYQGYFHATSSAQNRVDVLAGVGRQLSFWSNGSNRVMNIDTSGRVLINKTPAYDNIQSIVEGSNTPVLLQIQSGGSGSSAAAFINNHNSNPGYGGNLVLGRELSTGNVISNGMQLGAIHFNGHDGTNIVQSAAIQAYVDGASSGGDMPGRLAFYTALDGTDTLVERMRIADNGDIGIGAAPVASRKIFVSAGAAARSDIQLTYDALGNTNGDGVQFGIQTAGAYIWNFESSAVYFGTSNIERMRLDADGHLGLGVSPANWDTANTQAIQVDNASFAAINGNNPFITDNAYWNGSNWVYLSSNGATNYYSAAGTHYFRRAASGTAGNNVSFTEVARFDADGLYLPSGLGVKFSPHSSSNILDDYEYGTWTPTFSNLSSAATVTYTQRTGAYIKVGNLVYASFDCTASSISSGSGSPIITGLPFNATNSYSIMAGYSVIQWRDSSALTGGSTGTQLHGWVERNNNYLIPQFDNSGGSYGNAGYPSWSSSGRVTGYILYGTSS